MTCQRASSIDLAAFLADPRNAAWDEFRAHYPECGDCSSAVVMLSHFEAQLEQTAGWTHPEPPALLAFADRGTPLTSTERSRIQLHLERCPRCRDSLAAFHGFHTGLAALESPAGAVSLQTGAGLRRTLAALLSRLVPPAPLWAIAILAVLLGFGVWKWGTSGVAPRQELGPVASEQKIEAPVPRTDPAPPIPRDAVAEGTEPYAAPALPDLPGPVAPKPSAPSRGGSSAAPVDVARPAPLELQMPARSQREILLAMSELPLPRYAMPADAEKGWRVVDTAVRGKAEATQRLDVNVLAPDHVGLTRERSPTLYWFSASPIHHAVRFTLLDRDTDVAVELPLGEVPEAGFHAIDLAALQLKLEPGHVYQWSVSFQVGADGKQPEFAARAAVRRLETSAGNSDQDAPEARVQRDAAQGLWYDAFAAVSRAIEGGAPASLRQQRAALLEQVELREPAEYDRARSREDRPEQD